MENKLTVKMLMKTGQALIAYAEEAVVDELIYNPKFLKMHDTGNEIYLNVDDVVAFEVLNTRQQTEESPENNGKETPAAQA